MFGILTLFYCVITLVPRLRGRAKVFTGTDPFFSPTPSLSESSNPEKEAGQPSDLSAENPWRCWTINAW